MDTSPVDRKIFWWLLRYPLQRVEDLVLALSVSTNTIYRHLNRLVEEGLVEYITPSLNVQSTCRLYHLGNDGLLVAASLEGADVRTLSSEWSSNEQGILSLIPRVPALLTLQDVVNGLTTQASAMLAHTGGYRANISWHWQRNYRHTFSSQEGALTWSADAALLFYRKAAPLTARVNGPSEAAYYSALLFFDAGLTGMYDPQFITSRLEMLLRYRDQRESKDLSPLPFPPLLVITLTPLQRETWQRCVAALALARPAPVLSGAILCLDQQDATDSIWTLPWQQLSTRAPCRLRDLFSPLPENALPPGLLKRPAKAAPFEPPTESVLLRGDFSRRAQEFGSAHSRQDAMEDREVVALLGLCLSQRHRDIHHLCYTHPLLDHLEIASLCGLQPDTVRRYLSELRRYKCIEACETDFGTRWQVSELGLHFLAASLHCPLQHLAAHKETDKTPVQRGLSRLKKRMEQTVGIYTFFARLAEESRDKPGHEILWWERGPRCEWRFQDQGAWLTLRPGASFAYKTPSAQLRAWITWEGSGESREELVETMRTYARYTHKREWAAAGLSSPPMLLLITPEDHSPLKDIAREQLAASGLLVRAASAPHIAERGLFAPIWSQLLPPPASPASQPPRRGLLDLSLSTGQSPASRK